MASETSLALSVGIGRQEGFQTRANSSSAPSAMPSGTVAFGDKAANQEGQLLSASGQSLPPAGNVNEARQLQQAVSDINSYVQNLQRDLQFKVDTDLGATIISVVDSETKEIIRQLPPEEVIARAQRLEELRSADTGTDGLLLTAKI